MRFPRRRWPILPQVEQGQRRYPFLSTAESNHWIFILFRSEVVEVSVEFPGGIEIRRGRISDPLVGDEALDFFKIENDRGQTITALEVLMFPARQGLGLCLVAKDPKVGQGLGDLAQGF